jgi:hypothetical protein
MEFEEEGTLCKTKVLLGDSSDKVTKSDRLQSMIDRAFPDGLRISDDDGDEGEVTYLSIYSTPPIFMRRPIRKLHRYALIEKELRRKESIIWMKNCSVRQRVAFNFMTAIVINKLTLEVKDAGVYLCPESRGQPKSMYSATEISDLRTRKESLSHSIDVCLCDLAAKEVEIDALILQAQELDVFIGSLYSAYSNLLREVLRVQSAYEILQIENSNFVPSASELPNQDHTGSEREMLMKEKAGIVNNISLERLAILSLERNGDVEHNRVVGQLLALEVSHKQLLERVETSEQERIVLAKQRTDAQKALSMCEKHLEDASSSIKLKVI